jgi:effector-binding domain-containing protein
VDQAQREEKQLLGVRSTLESKYASRVVYPFLTKTIKEKGAAFNLPKIHRFFYRLTFYVPSMPELVNVVITQMRRDFPRFGLTGIMTAQGSEVGDCWELYISDDGFAKKRKLVITEKIITCPHCAGLINL